MKKRIKRKNTKKWLKQHGKELDPIIGEKLPFALVVANYLLPII